MRESIARRSLARRARAFAGASVGECPEEQKGFDGHGCRRNRQSLRRPSAETHGQRSDALAWQVNRRVALQLAVHGRHEPQGKGQMGSRTDRARTARRLRSRRAMTASHYARRGIERWGWPGSRRSSRRSEGLRASPRHCASREARPKTSGLHTEALALCWWCAGLVPPIGEPKLAL